MFLSFLKKRSPHPCFNMRWRFLTNFLFRYEAGKSFAVRIWWSIITFKRERDTHLGLARIDLLRCLFKCGRENEKEDYL